MNNWLTKTSQFKNGKAVENWLDSYFSQEGFAITRTTPEQERTQCLGDRIFARSGQRLFVEYKSGIQTHYTGNVFLETISVDDPTKFKAGWVYTCRADYLLYACLLDGCILVLQPATLRAAIDQLKQRFVVVPTSNNQNPGYNTHGVIVPLGYARERLAEKVIEVAV